jgi:arylsulfatase A-like enzyme
MKDGRRGGRDSADYSPPWQNGFDICFSTEQAVPTWDPVENQDIPTKYWTGPGQFAKDDLSGDDSKVITDRVIPFIERAVKKEQPFLAVVWFHTPHSPVVAGPRYRQLYEGYSEDKQHYYGCITAMDEQIGRLRRELRRLKIADNTIVFFTSDNGPAGKGGGILQYPGGRQQGSAGLFRGRKGSLYEGGIREPGLMEWPAGIRSPRKIYMPVSTCDYFPTILSILGFKDQGHPQPLDGINIMPVITGVMSERPIPMGFRLRKQRAWMDSRFKLYSPDDGKTYELYDMLNDPYESDNLAGRYPEKVREMAARLEEWIRSCEQSNQGKDYN